MRDAYTLRADYLNRVQIIPQGEKVVRPLRWLAKNDYGDQVSVVWEAACTLADGKHPDEKTVRKALSAWKADHLPKAQRTPTGKRGGSAAVNKWLRDAHRLMEEYPELFVDAVNKVELEAERYFAHPAADVADELRERVGGML